MPKGDGAEMAAVSFGEVLSRENSPFGNPD
jgi:hypothetical protein